MLKAYWTHYRLLFKQASGTSRGVLTHKDSYFIFIEDLENAGVTAIGECGLLKGLSSDPIKGYERFLDKVCHNIYDLEELEDEIIQYPSIRFGLEMAFADLDAKGSKILFPSDFTEGLVKQPINGLVWMGEFEFMKSQIEEKIKAGFNCIKLKIGAIDFEQELALIKNIRNEFKVNEIEIRVDANGAFSINEAMEKLKRLSDLDLHSIEQPIKQGQFEAMAQLCESTPLPIALDEELIGIHDLNEKKTLLKAINPQYIILKPSLLGGWQASEEWIDLAEAQNIGWWATSALESNIGLNAIAQWTYELNNPMHQGLGTGQLYTNNIPSPLYIEKGSIGYKPKDEWDFHILS